MLYLVKVGTDDKILLDALPKKRILDLMTLFCKDEGTYELALEEEMPDPFNEPDGTELVTLYEWLEQEGITLDEKTMDKWDDATLFRWLKSAIEDYPEVWVQSGPKGQTINPKYRNEIKMVLSKTKIRSLIPSLATPFARQVAADYRKRHGQDPRTTYRRGGGGRMNNAKVGYHPDDFDLLKAAMTKILSGKPDYYR